tara:strand:+ start:3910 stop:4671 length:762 start_codon:yes stop_codon:yes gene_type:complete
MLINEIRQMIREALQEASFGRAKEQMESGEFVLISAFRDYRSKKENLLKSKEMYQAITAAGYSYTRVGGGYSEPTVHGDEETGFHMMEPKGEDWEIVRHDVMENSVLITTARRGDVPVDPADRPPLFEFAKELADDFDQDAFIYGYPEVVRGPDGDESTRMFVAAYDRRAAQPGDKYRIPEPWAGPWTRFTPTVDGDIYFTKVAGKKGKLAEALYKNALLEVLSSPVKSRTEAMKKQYLVEKYRSALSLIEKI